MTPGPGIEPGPHWWKVSALTTAPSLLPYQPKGDLISYQPKGKVMQLVTLNHYNPDYKD